MREDDLPTRGGDRSRDIMCDAPIMNPVSHNTHGDSAL